MKSPQCSYDGCKEDGHIHITSPIGMEGDWCKPHYTLVRRKLNYIKFQDKINFPPIYKKATLDDFDTEILSDVDKSKSLYIFGESGCGKTHLASALIHNDYVNKNEYEIEFITMSKLLQRIRRTYNNDEGETEDEIIERFSKVKHLYIDDIGVEKPTDWVINIIYLILDERYTHELRTVFTSNLDLNQIKDRLGQRIASRVKGLGLVIEMGGGDRR